MTKQKKNPVAHIDLENKIIYIKQHFSFNPHRNKGLIVGNFKFSKDKKTITGLQTQHEFCSYDGDLEPEEVYKQCVKEHKTWFGFGKTIKYVPSGWIVLKKHLPFKATSPIGWTIVYE